MPPKKRPPKKPKPVEEPVEEPEEPEEPAPPPKPQQAPKPTVNPITTTVSYGGATATSDDPLRALGLAVGGSLAVGASSYLGKVLIEKYGPKAMEHIGEIEFPSFNFRWNKTNLSIKPPQPQRQKGGGKKEQAPKEPEGPVHPVTGEPIFVTNQIRPLGKAFALQQLPEKFKTPAELVPLPGRDSVVVNEKPRQLSFSSLYTKELEDISNPLLSEVPKSVDTPDVQATKQVSQSVNPITGSVTPSYNIPSTEQVKQAAQKNLTTMQKLEEEKRLREKPKRDQLEQMSLEEKKLRQIKIDMELSKIENQRRLQNAQEFSQRLAFEREELKLAQQHEEEKQKFQQKIEKENAKAKAAQQALDELKAGKKTQEEEQTKQQIADAEKAKVEADRQAEISKLQKEHEEASAKLQEIEKQSQEFAAEQKQAKTLEKLRTKIDTIKQKITEKTQPAVEPPSAEPVVQPIPEQVQVNPITSTARPEPIPKPVKMEDVKKAPLKEEVIPSGTIAMADTTMKKAKPLKKVTSLTETLTGIAKGEIPISVTAQHAPTTVSTTVKRPIELAKPPTFMEEDYQEGYPSKAFKTEKGVPIRNPIFEE